MISLHVWLTCFCTIFDMGFCLVCVDLASFSSLTTVCEVGPFFPSHPQDSNLDKNLDKKLGQILSRVFLLQSHLSKFGQGASQSTADNFCIRVIWGTCPGWGGVYAKHKEPCG